MIRIAMTLLLSLSSAAAYAHEAGMRAPDGSDCAEAHVASSGEDTAKGNKAAAPAGDAGAAPIRADGASGTRMSSPRWQSFLPGMLR